MVIKILLCNVFLASLCTIQAQVDDYVSALERELFKNDTSTVLLHEYVDSEDTTLNIDSTIRIRAAQPNPDIVIELLERIMHSREARYYDKLDDIYNRHLKNFWHEWSKIFIQNYYSPQLVIDQYSILSAFETVLKSFDFRLKDYSAKDIYNYYASEFMFIDSLIMYPRDRCRLMKSYEDKAQLYRDLSPCGLYKGSLTFNYIDPFVSELKPYFIETMKKCDWKQDEHGRLSRNCRLFLHTERYYHSLRDSIISDYLRNNYTQMKESNRHAIVYRYVGNDQNEDEVLTRFLVEKWIEEDNKDRRYHYEKALIQNGTDFNLDIVVEEFVELASRDSTKAKSLISRFPSTRIMEHLQMEKKTIDYLLRIIDSQ